MKRILFFVSVMVCLGVNICAAQTVYFNPVLSYSRLNFLSGTWLNNMQQHYKAPMLSYGFTAGAEYFQQKHYSISSDISSYQSGGNLTKEEKHLWLAASRYFPDESIKSSYISLGSTLNFNPINKKIILQLQVGPRIDYMVSTKAESYKNLENLDSLRRINYGFTSGIGLYYNLNKIRLGINARYLGRQKLTQSFEPDPRANVRYIGIQAGEYIFHFGASLGYILKKDTN